MVGVKNYIIPYNTLKKQTRVDFLMLYNFLLEIQHDWTFSNFSQKHPKVHLNLWCNRQSDILELRGDTAALEEAISDIENVKI